jgi:hypothetical protein
MKFPLQVLPRAYARWPLLALLLAFSLWLGSRAGGEGRLHNASVAPMGIISLERAGDPVTAKGIISFWDRWEGRPFAIQAIEIDFYFLVFYSTTLALGCVIAADRFYLIGSATGSAPSEPGQDSRPLSPWTRLGNLGILLAWGQWVAALLDVCENEALLRMLRHEPTRLNTAISWICADLKFALIGLGILYASVGVLTYFSLTFFKPHLVKSANETNVAEGQEA